MRYLEEFHSPNFVQEEHSKGVRQDLEKRKIEQENYKKTLSQAKVVFGSTALKSLEPIDYSKPIDLRMSTIELTDQNGDQTKLITSREILAKFSKIVRQTIQETGLTKSQIMQAFLENLTKARKITKNHKRGVQEIEIDDKILRELIGTTKMIVKSKGGNDQTPPVIQHQITRALQNSLQKNIVVEENKIPIFTGEE
jgi:hypothetical protein